MLAVAERTTTDHPAAVSRALAAVKAATDNHRRNVEATERGIARALAHAEEAAAYEPQALAGATTDAERKLIRKLFKAIPACLALSREHSLADLNDAPEADAIEDRWSSLRRQVETHALALMNLPPESAHHAVRRLCLGKKALVLAESLPDGQIGNFDAWLEEDVVSFAKAAVAALEHLAAGPDRTQWLAALGRLAEAEQATQDNARQCDELEAKLAALAPAELLSPRSPADVRPSVRWCSSLNCERTARGEDRNLIPLVEAFFSRPEVQAVRAELDAAQQESDRLIDAETDRELEVMRTPAPDLEAVLWKQNRYGMVTDDAREGYADLIRAAAIRDGARTDAWPLLIHQDVLRITGTASPLVDLGTFSPGAWAEAFREAGGTIRVDRDSYPWTVEISSPFNKEGAGEVEALLAELAIGQNRAVFRCWAKEVY